MSVQVERLDSREEEQAAVEVESRSPETHPVADEFYYRSLSRSAVASLVLAVVGAGAFLSPVLVPLLALGVLCGVMAIRTIRSNPQDYCGGGLAITGTLLGALLFAGSVGYHSYVYAHEVPPDTQRIHFDLLQPTDPNNTYITPPDRAVALDGQRVFIKGYIHPDAGMAPVATFILVPDYGTCCFGGQPKATDMIEVRLADGLRATYSMRKRKLAGVLRVNPELRPVDSLGGVFYTLEADYIQ